MGTDADVDRQINDMLASVTTQMDAIKGTVGAIAEMVARRGAGDTGPQGEKGDTGPEGPRGPKGDKGERGRDRA